MHEHVSSPKGIVYNPSASWEKIILGLFLFCFSHKAFRFLFPHAVFCFTLDLSGVHEDWGKAVLIQRIKDLIKKTKKQTEL